MHFLRIGREGLIRANKFQIHIVVHKDNGVH